MINFFGEDSDVGHQRVRTHLCSMIRLRIDTISTALGYWMIDSEVIRRIFTFRQDVYFVGTLLAVGPSRALSLLFTKTGRPINFKGGNGISQQASALRTDRPNASLPGEMKKSEQQNSRTEMMRIMEKVWRGIIRTR